MTSIYNTNHSQVHGNRFHRSNSRNVNSRHFEERTKSRRRGGGRSRRGGGRRQHIRQQMGRMANNQSQHLRSNRQNRPHTCPRNNSSTANNNSINQQINSLLQGLGGSGSIDQLLQGLGGMGDIGDSNILNQLLQSLGGANSSDEITQLLGQLGLGNFGSAGNTANTGDSNTPMPVEPNNGIGDGAGSIPTTSNVDSQIQSLLGDLDMGQLNDLLQMFSLDDLAKMLSAEGTNVSADEIAQLLGQFGLGDFGSTGNTTNTGDSNTSIPVEPNNGIGDGAGPIPTTPNTNSNTNSNVDSQIQSLLGDLDMGQLNDLLQMFSLDDLAKMLSAEGTNVTADEIAQLLGQLGLGNFGSTGNTTNTGDSNTPMPVEPNNGIGDGASPIPTTPNTNSNVDSQIQSLLGSFDMNQLNDLLQMFSLDDLAKMLSAEGTNVSASEIAQLLGQLGLSSSASATTATSANSNTTDTVSTPATSTSSSSDTTTNTPTTSTSSSSDTETNTQTTSTTSSTTDTTNDPSTSTDSTTDTITSTPTSSNNLNGEIQSLLQSIDSSQFSAFFDSFSPQQLADMLTQEGTKTSASEVSDLLSQIGLRP